MKVIVCAYSLLVATLLDPQRSKIHWAKLLVDVTSGNGFCTDLELKLAQEKKYKRFFS